jgi:hypothetical protein
MAQKTIVTKIDDLDASVTDEDGTVIETIPFALDGVEHEIDLGPDNADRLRGTFAPYRDKARKLSGIGARRPAGRLRAASSANGSGPGSEYTAAQRKEIRQWAIAHGARIGERGRLPESVYDAWRTKDATKLPKSDVLEATAPEPQPVS